MQTKNTKELRQQVKHSGETGRKAKLCRAVLTESLKEINPSR
jgi:hypothetical protein